MRSWIALLFTLLFGALIFGCAKSLNPTQPPLDPAFPQVNATVDPAVNSDNRAVWGLWKLAFPADRSRIDVIPDRTGAMHLNTVRLLETAPCTDCLTIENLIILSSTEVQADLVLRHPQPGVLKTTGFDVRGIFITGSNYTFPDSGRTVSVGVNAPLLLYPDGYTSLFNPTEFPETTPPALGYIHGNFAPGISQSATLNPFIAYEKDMPRRMFAPGTIGTRTVKLFLPDGYVECGYAVDACWTFVDGEVGDPLTDFPPDANCLEAYKIDVEVGPGLRIADGGAAEIQVEVWDHQGLESIVAVDVEAPNLFVGTVPLDFALVTSSGSYLYTGTITNDLGAVDGEYPVLVRVEELEPDQNLGAIDAWNIFRANLGPERGWARTFGGIMYDDGYGAAIDASDYIYVTGSFRTACDFDPSGDIEFHVSEGWYDPYVCKYDQAGNYLWAKTWGGDMTDWGLGIAADSTGSVYVCGAYDDTVDFDPGPGVVEHTTVGRKDAFVSKFNGDGELEWVRVFGGERDDYAYDVAVDDLGNVFLTGFFHRTADFDPGPGVDEHSTWGPADKRDVFLSCLNSSGDFQWAHTWGGLLEDEGFGVEVDNLGNVWVTGNWQWTVDFDPGDGVIEYTSTDTRDGFLSKFDSDGNLVWVDTWGYGPLTWPYDVVLDEQGNSFTTGVYGGFGGTGSFLRKSTDFGQLLWVLNWRGEGNNWAQAIALDSLGYVYVSGYFIGETDFDTGSGSKIYTSNGERDFYVCKFSSSGFFQWARTFGGEESEYGLGCAVDSDDNVYTTGRFASPVDFNPNLGVDLHTPKGDFDIFLSKLPPDGFW